MAARTISSYISRMDLSALWDSLVSVIGGMPRSGLLVATLAAVMAGIVGTAFLNVVPGLGRLLRRASTLVLAGVLVLVVLQISRFDPRFDLAVPELGLPEQIVEGGETRISLAPDGHYWVRAQVNGVPAAFLVDTGATLTTLNTDTAAAAGLEPRRGGIPIMLQTANGTVSAEVATIDELTFGNVTARGLDAAIAPNIGRTNVLGMNVLSRLGSWRVEQGTMILTPPAAAE